MCQVFVDNRHHLCETTLEFQAIIQVASSSSPSEFVLFVRSTLQVVAISRVYLPSSPIGSCCLCETTLTVNTSVRLCNQHFCAKNHMDEAIVRTYLPSSLGRPTL